MAQDASAIREEIEQTRAEVAATVQALGQKADVAGRMKATALGKVEQAKATASDKFGQLQGKTQELQARVGGGAQLGVAAVVQKASDQRGLIAMAFAFLGGVVVGRRWRGAAS
jgi:preprotein translocase subunit SecF